MRWIFRLEKIGESVKILKVAVTGSVASGKSTVCRFFKQHGAYTIDADAVVHNLISSDTECIQKITQLLGNQVLVQGQIRRDIVASMVFNDSSRLQKLQQILHPKVFAKIEQEYENVKGQTDLFVAEVPLLFESGFDQFFDYTVVVEAPRDICLERAHAKGMNEKEYDQRMSKRLSLDVMKEKADFIIHNQGTLESVEKQVKTIINKFRS